MERECKKLAERRTGESHDEEDEALSLCDLPVQTMEEEDHHNSHFKYEKPKSATESSFDDKDEEFDFVSVGAPSNQPLPPMCLADEVFFQGQILPVRLSVSSDNSSAGFCHRGGSVVAGKFRSVNSSRSNSSRSQYSTSTTNNSAAAAVVRPRVVPNLFHSHPSPKPQIRTSPTTFRQTSNGGGRSLKSSTWDFFRLDLVKTPGMELQDLKHRSSTNRNSVSRNNSGRGFSFTPNNNGGSGSGGGSSTSSSTNREKEKMRARARITIERKSGILSGFGCKCSVEIVAPKLVVRSNNGGINVKSMTSSAAAAAAAMALREVKMKKFEKEKEEEEEEKLALSRHRTFEWLKDLSHATFPCDP